MAAEGELVAEQVCTECTKHMSSIAQLKVDVHKGKGKLEFVERCNTVSDYWCFLLIDEFDTLKQQLFCNGTCDWGMVQWFANAFKDDT